MTQRELFTRLSEVVNMTEVEDKVALIDGLNERIARLDDKARNKSIKPTKTQIENVKILADIENHLATNGRATCTEIGKVLGYSSQKISAVAKQSKIISRETEKGTTYLYVADSGVEALPNEITA